MVAGAFLTAGTFVAVCARGGWCGPAPPAKPTVPARPSWDASSLVSAVGLFFTGDAQGKLMFQQQPMKMASAESLCHSEPTRLLHPDRRNAQQLRQRRSPRRSPVRASLPRRGTLRDVNLEGVNDLQEEYQAKYGPGDYR